MERIDRILAIFIIAPRLGSIEIWDGITLLTFLIRQLIYRQLIKIAVMLYEVWYMAKPRVEVCYKRTVPLPLFYKCRFGGG